FKEASMTFDHDLNRRRAVQLSVLGAAASLIPGGLAATPASAAASGDPAAHDFDLFFGSWHVKHRRIKERLAGSNEWIEFDGTSVMQPILGGLGNMDDNIFNFPPGPFRGVSVRAFDPATKTWAIWWLDTRDLSKIDVPVVGTFKDGVGTFL